MQFKFGVHPSERDFQKIHPSEHEIIAEKRDLISYLYEGNIDRAKELLAGIGHFSEALQDSDVQVAVKHALVSHLSNGLIKDAKEIVTMFNPSAEVLQSAEVQEAVREELDYFLLPQSDWDNDREEYFEDYSICDSAMAQEIINTFNPPVELVHWVLIRALNCRLSSDDINSAQEIITTFNPSPEIIQEAVKQGLINRLFDGHVTSAKKIIDLFNLPAEIIHSTEVQKALKQGLIYQLSYGYANSAKEIITTFNPSDEIIHSVEVHEAIKQGLISRLSGGSIDSAKEIITTFNPSPEIIQEALKQGLINQLHNSNVDSAKEIITTFNPSPEIIQEAVKQGLINQLSGGNITSAKEIIATLNPSAEVIHSIEVQEALKRIIITHISNYPIDSSKEIITTFNLSVEVIPSVEVQEAVKKELIYQLSYGSINLAEEIITTFNPTAEIVQEAIKQGLIYQLSDGSFSSAQEIITTFNPSPEIIQEAVKQGLINLLSNSLISSAKEIITTFNLSQEIVQEAIKQGLINQLSDGNITSAKEIITTFNVPIEEFYRNCNTKIKVLMFRYGLVDESVVEDAVKSMVKLENIDLQINNISEKEKHITLGILEEDDWSFLDDLTIFNGFSEQEINTAHAELLEIFQKSMSEYDRAEYLQKCKETGVRNPFEPYRLLKIILDLDINNGETRVAKFMQQSDMPDRIWSYFARKLIEKEFFTKNLTKYIAGPSLPVLRKLLSQSPMDLNTIVDTATSLGITNLAEESETLFSAMKDIGGVTPEVYKQYKTLQGEARNEFVEKIKVLKSKFFGNTPIDKLGVEENIVKEVLYLSYKPTNTSYDGVLDYLRRVPDCTEHLAGYKFPQNGYDVVLKDVEVKLKPESKIKFNFDEFKLMLEDKSITEKDINQTLMWIAKGSTSPTLDQMGILLNFLPKDDRKRLVDKIQGVENDKDMFSVLNNVVEFLGIFAKDNLPKALQEYLDKDEQLMERLSSTLKQEKYGRLLKAKLGEDYAERRVDNNLSKLVIGLLQIKQQKAKKDIRSFVRADGSMASESINRYKMYLSKNKASFFAKASGGICTADNIDLFKMKNHLHFNIVRNDEVVLGNIQGYTHTDSAGKKILILRGFNPSDSALKEFSAEAFVEAGLKVGRQFVKDNNFDKFTIVYDDGWHPLSNREQIRSYFSSKYGNAGKELSIPSLDISARGKIINSVRDLS